MVSRALVPCFIAVVQWRFLAPAFEPGPFSDRLLSELLRASLQLKKGPPLITPARRFAKVTLPINLVPPRIGRPCNIASCQGANHADTGLPGLTSHSFSLTLSCPCRRWIAI